MALRERLSRTMIAGGSGLGFDTLSYRASIRHEAARFLDFAPPWGYIRPRYAAGSSDAIPHGPDPFSRVDLSLPGLSRVLRPAPGRNFRLGARSHHRARIARLSGPLPRRLVRPRIEPDPARPSRSRSRPGRGDRTARRRRASRSRRPRRPPLRRHVQHDPGVLGGESERPGRVMVVRRPGFRPSAPRPIEPGHRGWSDGGAGGPLLDQPVLAEL